MAADSSGTACLVVVSDRRADREAAASLHTVAKIPLFALHNAPEAVFTSLAAGSHAAPGSGANRRSFNGVKGLKNLDKNFAVRIFMHIFASLVSYRYRNGLFTQIKKGEKNQKKGTLITNPFQFYFVL